MAKKTKSDATSEKSFRGVNLEEVERLLGFMKKHDLEQFEYEAGGIHIMLKKASGRPSTRAQAVSGYEKPSSEAVAEPASTAPAASAEVAQKPAASSADEELHVIKSPIVGTYYEAPSPDADSFVKVGARVESGQVLCIIEAMKLMNEIEADVAGEVVKIHPGNGQPVEYGELLFSIRPDRKK
jgi:acetyl-CoA carboxylase biotin carboxyl carrier protein